MQGTCTIEGCDSGWTRINLGYCDLHYYRNYQYGDPLTPTRILAKRNGEVIRYATAHMKITKERGRAKDHTCEHCGKPARDWAYDGEDPDERIDAVDGKRVFSVNFEHYHALCRSCHLRMDEERFRSVNRYRSRNPQTSRN